MKPMREPAMTPEQNLRAAVGHWCDGVEYEPIAQLYATNNGRVAEACLVLRIVAQDPKRAREILEAGGMGKAWLAAQTNGSRQQLLLEE